MKRVEDPAKAVFDRSIVMLFCLITQGGMFFFLLFPFLFVGGNMVCYLKVVVNFKI